uniref:Cystathionine gamma-lyase n=1 Tax=Panagrolaimus sp. PS1159 TaxID=55785 RepID=A0AC35G8T5_9BILA
MYKLSSILRTHLIPNKYISLKFARKKMSPPTTNRFGTKAIHAGQDPEKWGSNEVIPPITLSTTFKQTHPGVYKTHDYSRCGNPTRDVLQELLATLEGAKYCSTFGSGLASVMSTINYLKTGDHIICADNVYGGTYEYLTTVSVPQHGLTVDFIDFTNLDNLKTALKSETKMIWFESPSNPLLKLVDISEAVKIAKSFNKDILVVTDSTFMSPYFQNPLSFGVDIVIHSITKYINGHSDVTMGAAITNNPELGKHFIRMQKVAGAVPSPFDCYLVTRGLKTLHVRMRTHYENALAVAKFLEGHNCVEKVLYPALESHPQHEIHKKQTSGMSGMVAVYIKGGTEEARNFVENLKIFALAVSLGAAESYAAVPALMTHEQVALEDRLKVGITDNLIRLSVGLEDKNDLIEDLDQALKIAVLSNELGKQNIGQ